MSEPNQQQTNGQQNEVARLKAELAERDKRIADMQAGKAAQGAPYAKEAQDLTELLMGGPKLLAELPKHLQAPGFLLHATRAKLIEFGRPPHEFNSKGEMITSAGQLIDAKGRMVNLEGREPKDMPKPAKGEMSWTSACGPNAKPLPELLNEDKTMHESVRLRVRLAPVA